MKSASPLIPASATCPRAFTLVELLVVMSIVSLLIALLIPALGAARSTSRAVQCNSNMRQTAIAVINYAADCNDLLPWNNTGGNSNGYNIWPQFIKDSRIDVAKSPKLEFAGGTRTAPQPGVLTCPDGLYEIALNPTLNDLQTTTGYWRNSSIGLTTIYVQAGFASTQANINAVFTHYVLNVVNCARMNANGSVKYGPLGGKAFYTGFSNQCTVGSTIPVDTQRRLASCSYPSNTWMASDGYNESFGTIFTLFRHPNLNAGFSYFDGHVQLIAPENIDGNLSNTGAWGGNVVLTATTPTTGAPWDVRLNFLR